MTIETATAEATQDISEVIEQRLFGSNDEPEITDESAQDDAEVEAELPESDDDDSEDEGSDDQEVDETEEDDFSLASQLGIDEDRLKLSDDGDVLVESIVDGEKKDVSLKDLVSSYQLQGHVNNKSMALETERKEFQSQIEAVGNEMKTRVEGLDGLTKLIETQLVGEYNGIDWEALRSADPAEYTALRQDFSDRAKDLQHKKGLISEEAKRATAEAQQQQAKLYQEHLQSEYSLLLEKNPEWKDEVVYKKDMSNIKDFVTSEYGFNDQDLDAVGDHRLVALIKDAYAYRNGKKTAEAKKVKSIPKFQKPGAKRTNSESLAKARDVKARKAAVKKTGKVQDVANLLLDRM